MKKNYKISIDDYNHLVNVLKKSKSQEAINLLNNTIKQSDKKILSNKEFLNNLKMSELFGANYKDVVYYNFDTKQWVGKRVDLSKLKGKSYEIGLLRRVLEAECKKIGVELVALATIPTSDVYYRGWGKCLENVKSDASGHVLAGVLVWRDKASGKLQPIEKNWVQGEFFLCDKNSQEEAINRFVQDIIRYENFKQGILTGQGRCI